MYDPLRIISPPRLQVCPPRFARALEVALKQSGNAFVQTHFVQAGHRATEDGIAQALSQSVREFLAFQEAEDSTDVWHECLPARRLLSRAKAHLSTAGDCCAGVWCWKSLMRGPKGV